jgi:hypothetical protein
MAKCEHTQIEKETALADGLCPICQVQRIEELKKENKELRILVCKQAEILESER